MTDAERPDQAATSSRPDPAGPENTSDVEKPVAPPPSTPSTPAPAPAPQLPAATPEGLDAVNSDRDNPRSWYDAQADGAAANSSAEDSNSDMSWHTDSSSGPEGGSHQQWQRVTTHGATAFGPGAQAFNLITKNGKRITVLKSQETATRIGSITETYVTVDGFEQIRGELANNRLTYLCGTAGGGRRTTAQMLLAAVVGPDKVAGIAVAEPDVTLAELAGEADLITPGHGVILELTEPGTVSAGTLSTFATMARRCDAYLVILDDRADAPEPSLRPYGALHTPPDAANVIRRHLPRLLKQSARCVGTCGRCVDSCHQAFVEKCLDQEDVTKALTAHPKPGSAVELAETLANWSGKEKELKQAMRGLRSRVRELAAKLLKHEHPNAETGNAQPPTPRRQAFQIAYAVFDGYPLADVFNAGELLLSILWQVQGDEERPARVVFDGGVDQMLNTGLGATGTLSPDNVTEHPRRARLADRRLQVDVLDVVWHDFDSVRVPLLAWLNTLVFGRRESLRSRAAEVAGLLATYDFGEVYRVLIGPWARSPKGFVRQAAVIALDSALDNTQFFDRIWRQVDDWVQSPNALLHDTAARTYATRLGTALPTLALHNLRILAGRDTLNASASVAHALCAVYEFAADQTRECLVEWNRDDTYRVRVHAVRGLILLARLVTDQNDRLWPVLLLHTAGSTSATQDLVTLWRAALTEPTTAYRAWQQLHAWVRLADTDAELGDQITALVSRILAGPTATRGRFHLQIWSRGDSGSKTARRLLSLPWENPADRAADHVPANDTPGGRS
ncbi:hypothetical protein GCM10027290_38480 [Micromonospora sonneratiae]|uniref:4Fe-4S ferredoxin-type domain-containing protein n=1 Tax=Micromonospora sonneratiae TaxID=1184706 RepID=A0ABW3Y8Y2_9ACTN